MSQILSSKSILVVVAVLIVVGVGFGFFLWKALDSEPQDTQIEGKEQTNPEIDTSGWKTYRNEEYGFEVKYPIFWQNNPGPLPYVFLFGPPGESNEYQVQIWVTSESNLDQFYEDKTEKCAKILFLGQDAYRCEGESTVTQERGVDTDYPATFIYIETEHKGSFYFLGVKGSKSAVRFKIFEVMLSTFRFIESKV